MLLNSEHGRIVLMILIVLVSLFLCWLVKRIIYFVFKKIIAKRKIDPGKLVLLIFVIRLLIIIVGVSYAISLDPSIESVTKSMIASAGIATAIIGFAAKDVLSNIVSGAMIVIFRPFTISHWIKVGEISEGRVEKIKMLYTVIRDETNRRLIIPNSEIVSSKIINSSYHDEDVMQLVEFSISYESDIDKAKAIISGVAEANPLSIDKRSKSQKENNRPIVEVGVSKLGMYSIELSAVVWIANPKDYLALNWTLNEEVRKRFNKEGIQFPYPNLIVRDKQIKSDNNQ